MPIIAATYISALSYRLPYLCTSYHSHSYFHAQSKSLFSSSRSLSSCLVDRNRTDTIEMESVNIPADNVPAELKACDQILKRAKELKKAEPVMAYWCE
jgi:hypothetical protein